MERATVIKFDSNLNDTICLCKSHTIEPYGCRKGSTVIIIIPLILLLPWFYVSIPASLR